MFIHFIQSYKNLRYFTNYRWLIVIYGKIQIGYETSNGKISTKSTSSQSADVVDPFILEEKKSTRRVFQAEINDSKKDSGETVSGTILHQRKNNAQEWENEPAFNLTKIKAGEEIKIRLGSKQVKNLYDALSKLYSISKEGVKLGTNEFTTAKADEVIKVPKDRKIFVERLLEQDFATEVWEELVKTDPDLATRLSNARIQQDRIIALNDFRDSMSKELGEDYWQDFFANNQWIFGYGLNYQFLDQITDQPHYGGADVSGKGNQKGDYLMSTSAEINFTVLVEIKKPETKLLCYRKNQKPIKYRNGAMLLSRELLGATSQIQANVNKWAVNSQLPDKRIEGVETIVPKGLLVIGNLNELTEKEMVQTFENYRRNMSNPEVITFDELFERAKYIVNKKEEGSDENEELKTDNSDIPF